MIGLGSSVQDQDLTEKVETKLDKVYKQQIISDFEVKDIKATMANAQQNNQSVQQNNIVIDLSKEDDDLFQLLGLDESSKQLVYERMEKRKKESADRAYELGKYAGLKQSRKKSVEQNGETSGVNRSNKAVVRTGGMHGFAVRNRDSNDDGNTGYHNDYSDGDNDSSEDDEEQGNSQTISVTGANFNIPIPRFDPRRQTASTYLSEVESFFKIQHFHKNQFLSMVRTNLAKEVKAWFDNCRSNINTWAEFKILFKMKYDGQTERVMRQNLLANRKQKHHESFETYVWEMVSLSKQVNEDEPPCDVVRRCRDGLINEVRMLVGYNDGWTAQDLLDDIKRVVSDLKQREKTMGISLNIPPISVAHKQSISFNGNSPTRQFRGNRGNHFRRNFGRFTHNSFHSRGNFHNNGYNTNFNANTNFSNFQNNNQPNNDIRNPNNNALPITQGNIRGNFRGNGRGFRGNGGNRRPFVTFPNSDRSQNSNQNAITCYNCGELGHISRNCRNPNRNFNQSANPNQNHFQQNHHRNSFNQIGPYNANQIQSIGGRQFKLFLFSQQTDLFF